MSKNTNVVVSSFSEPPDDRKIKESLARHLAKNRTEYVRWVQKNVKSASLRRHALEQGAYHFVHEYYDSLVYVYRQKIERLYEYKLRLLDHHRKYQQQIAIDAAELQVRLTKLGAEQLSVIKETRRLLTPPVREADKIEKLRQQDKLELTRLQLRQRTRRLKQKAVMAEAAERAQIRTKFIADLNAQYDDPDLIQEAIDEFDRSLFGPGDDE